MQITRVSIATNCATFTYCIKTFPNEPVKEFGPRPPCRCGMTPPRTIAMQKADTTRYAFMGSFLSVPRLSWSVMCLIESKQINGPGSNLFCDNTKHFFNRGDTLRRFENTVFGHRQ